MREETNKESTLYFNYEAKHMICYAIRSVKYGTKSAREKKHVLRYPTRKQCVTNLSLGNLSLSSF